MTSLFGGETNYVTMIVALAIVLALIVLAVWLIKVMGQATRTIGRGRQRRLSIVDSIPIDQKRQAIIIRRDGVEHLIVIGGTNDLVVETGFEAPALTTPVRPGRRMIPTSASEAETPPANVSRLENTSSTSKPKSLRHTGLLRATDGQGGELPGGKRATAGAPAIDSATNGMSDDREPALETVAESGENDNADKNKGRRT
nr:flagellar biosynthetic protein FliO [Pelagibacterium limicola]